MSVRPLGKVFMLTKSGKQSSNNCEHITQWKIVHRCEPFLNKMRVKRYLTFFSVNFGDTFISNGCRQETGKSYLRYCSSPETTM